MIISVASGKGGTGKTTVATNLALAICAGLPEKIQFLDCDVEEPNAHIFLQPEFSSSQSVAVPVPQVDKDKCDGCGKCSEVCTYNAIAVIKGKVLLFPELCHGCGGCFLLCPRQAITEGRREVGVVEKGKAGGLEFIQGRLRVGEAMSTPLIRAVKSRIAGDKATIIDVPPGTSCPVIEAVKGSDFCILVTEPTPFGLNDLTLAVELLRSLQIPFGVVINRADVGDEKIDRYCRKESLLILMRIPLDKEIAMAYSKGIPLIIDKPEWKNRFRNLYNQIGRTIQS
jgi:MinD superfamily P-loop ATPase